MPAVQSSPDPAGEASLSASYDEVTVESRAEWRVWLKAHHATAPGVWLIRYKKASGRPYLAYDDIVEEALAHGWIDSLARTVDGERSKLLITPRKPTSKWSRLNKQRVERLLAAGLMRPAGLAAVETARRNGTWTALDAVEALEEPDDLRAALDAGGDARRHWDAFPRSAKRAILEWVASAKTRETREKRVAETARLAADNVRANQWRRPGAAPAREPGRER